MKNVHLSFPMISRNNSVLGLKITTIVAAAHARTTKAFRSRKNRIIKSDIASIQDEPTQIWKTQMAMR